MKDNVTHIPALRFGEAYKSLDTNDLGTVLRSGSRLEVSVVNAGIIRRDKQAIERARAALRKIPAETLLGYAERLRRSTWKGSCHSVWMGKRKRLLTT